MRYTGSLGSLGWDLRFVTLKRSKEGVELFWTVTRLFPLVFFFFRAANALPSVNRCHWMPIYAHGCQWMPIWLPIPLYGLLICDYVNVLPTSTPTIGSVCICMYVLNSGPTYVTRLVPVHNSENGHVSFWNVSFLNVLLFRRCIWTNEKKTSPAEKCLFTANVLGRSVLVRGEASTVVWFYCDVQRRARGGSLGAFSAIKALILTGWQRGLFCVNLWSHGILMVLFTTCYDHFMLT